MKDPRSGSCGARRGRPRNEGARARLSHQHGADAAGGNRSGYGDRATAIVPSRAAAHRCVVVVSWAVKQLGGDCPLRAKAMGEVAPIRVMGWGARERVSHWTRQRRVTTGEAGSAGPGWWMVISPTSYTMCLERSRMCQVVQPP